MSHALIIDDNMIVSQAIENRLVELGFDAFDRTWTEGQAIAAAARRPTDLVVTGDTIASGCALNAARSIRMQRDIPVLMITADAGRAHRLLPDDVSFEGPFLLNEIETAVELAGASNRPISQATGSASMQKIHPGAKLAGAVAPRRALS